MTLNGVMTANPRYFCGSWSSCVKGPCLSKHSWHAGNSYSDNK